MKTKQKQSIDVFRLLLCLITCLLLLSATPVFAETNTASADAVAIQTAPQDTQTDSDTSSVPERNNNETAAFAPSSKPSSDTSSMPQNAADAPSANSSTEQAADNSGTFAAPDRQQMQNRGPGSNDRSMGGHNPWEDQSEKTFWEQYGTAITSVVLLAVGFVFVLFYKRKNY